MSTRTFPGPPARPDRWIRRRLGSSEAMRSVVGDLHEEFHELRERRGPRLAALWFWKEALLLSLTLAGIAQAGRHDTRSHMSSFFSPSSWLQDTRYALRAVRKDLGLFSFAVVIVGLGIGACTAIFSVLNPLLLSPLPFPDADRLVVIDNDGNPDSLSSITSRTSNLRDFRTDTETFDGLTGFFAFFGSRSYNLVGDGPPQKLMGVDVAADFLDVLGVEPALGRGFSAEEGLWGAAPTAILSHRFWNLRFGADPDVIGKTLPLDDRSFEIVGVLPASFDFSQLFSPNLNVDFLLPFPIADETDRWGNTLTMVGRLAPGVTVPQAQADLDNAIAGLEAADGERWGLGARVTPLRERISGPFRNALLLLGIAAGSVLLIVCVNLSNLLLAKSERRRREMAVRSALGASRARLVRQMLLESTVLSAAGALLGIGLAALVVRSVSQLQGLKVPMLADVTLDSQVLGFSILLTTCVGLLVGILPALGLSRQDRAQVTRGSRRTSSASKQSARYRELLIVAEVALACALLIVGGLLLQSFRNVMDVEIGFDAAEVTAWQLNAGRSFEDDAGRNAYFEQLRDRVAAVSGVESAGLVDAIPFGRNRTWPLSAAGYTYPNEQSALYAFPHMVDDAYLQTLDISLVAGRYFEPTDTADSRPVVILNETAAKDIMNGEDPLGREVLIQNTAVEVVGIVRDIRHVHLETGSGPQMYLNFHQVPAYNSLDLVVRSTLPTATLVPAVRAAIAELDSNLPTESFVSLAGVVERSSSPRRLTLQVLVAFAGIALILAALGIYGVLSYSVAEQVPEIGIRMALGETRGDVLRRIVGRTLSLSSVGWLLGLGVAWVLNRWVSSMLYGVEANDPSNLVAGSVLLLVVAGLAGLVPALRAARLDIASVLRSAT